jgi:predicted pyridoxine 5'-phosphate oxidase superfamily flavin-nucleotide-binding protein
LAKIWLCEKSSWPDFQTFCAEPGYVMSENFQKIVTTPAVTRAQIHYSGRPRVASPLVPSIDIAASETEPHDLLTPEEIEFISRRDSFYMASVTENGWPYVQHRGGRPGFLRVLSPSQLAFADYKGNRQMLSTGNLSANNRVALFLMDYPERNRLKILGHAGIKDVREHPELVSQLAEKDVQPIVERFFIIQVVAFDWNCSKYITPRYTAEEVAHAIAPLKERIAELEARVKECAGQPAAIAKNDG